MKVSASLLAFCLIGFGLCFQSCEEIDDGSFTPQVIAPTPPPPDTSFTVEDPCLTSSCGLKMLMLPGTSGEFEQEFYGNYDILREDAVWGTLTSAVIVIHGNNRNANEYFNWMTNAVLSLGKQNETIIIAPQFKLSGDVGNNDKALFWSNNGWKRGFQSLNIDATKYSSYDVVDSMIAILSDKTHFPNLTRIVLTGHSAGAQFTNVYAAASPMEDIVSGVEVKYLVANSQYFFYPGPERWDPASSQFTVPAGCDGYQDWPYGTERLIEYASRFQPSEIRDRFVNRRLTFLLGSLDLFTSGSLNTTDCEAALLGENRFRRGENIFNYIETFFPGSNGHEKVLVNNVGHDAAQMYNSASGLEALGKLLE